MTRTLTLLLLLSVNLLAACTDNTVTRQIGENGSASLVSFSNNSQHENTVSRQADALNGLSNDLVLASTIKGAKIGAVVGCGLAILSASNAKNCIVGAVTGGATGALIGHSSGKIQIAQRVELVNPNQLVRNIRKTNDTMEILTTSLPDLLEAQNEELEVLSFNRDMGTLSQEAYEKRYSEIQASRTALAESLSLSASQANLATNNLENAATRGQTGLEWHFGATKQIAEQAESARSSISLL
ncbi:MAG: glycine zipper family protein [Ascidiaceihabitans sp.]|nr:glycine zipper family protein [Ascidiaceihabitans sp.]